ncbi:uncharacterized protein BJX67DRAFT_344715, partial [Aspergillus lucknowensis]
MHSRRAKRTQSRTCLILVTVWSRLDSLQSWGFPRCSPREAEVWPFMVDDRPMMGGEGMNCRSVLRVMNFVFSCLQGILKVE